jgi:hypothetical protein
MKWIILLSLVITNILATDSKHDDYYDFLQPLIVNLDENQSQNHTNRQISLSRFTRLATTAPHSKEFYYLNYKLMQEFQYLHFHMKIKDNINITKKRELFIRDKNLFIKTLTSIEEPSFFTLYSKLYLETLDSKRLKHKDLMKLYSLTSKEKQPYVQLLSYVDSLNQLNSISIIDQNNLHKKLTLLLIGLPKKQQGYILRLTALQLQPLYAKDSIEFEFNRLFAQKSIIKREEILHVLNFKDADSLKDYIMKKRRSFFEERVFKTNMNALKRNDIAMILAKLYIQKENFDEARSYIRQAPRSNLYSEYNPFSSSIELDNKRVYKKSSSLRTFAETMSRLEKRLKKESPLARDFYLFGNGLYNKSFFGNFPMSSVFFHNSDIDKEHIPPTTNLTKAYKAYERALQISTKEEFRAEIAYQILKIEFQMAMTNSKNYLRSMHKIPNTDETKKVKHLLIESRSFIETMQDYKLDYAHTTYGKRVIKESILFSYL